MKISICCRSNFFHKSKQIAWLGQKTQDYSELKNTHHFLINKTCLNYFILEAKKRLNSVIYHHTFSKAEFLPPILVLFSLIPCE